MFIIEFLDVNKTDLRPSTPTTFASIYSVIINVSYEIRANN